MKRRRVEAANLSYQEPIVELTWYRIKLAPRLYGFPKAQSNRSEPIPKPLPAPPMPKSINVKRTTTAPRNNARSHATKTHLSPSSVHSSRLNPAHNNSNSTQPAHGPHTKAMSTPGNLEQEVKYEARGDVAIITLNLPHKLNAVTQAHYFRVASLLHQIAANDAITVTVLTGTGRFFSAYASPAPLLLPLCLSLHAPASPPPPHPRADAAAYHSGADVTISRSGPTDAATTPREHWLRTFVANNLHTTHAFYAHPKILVAALNGPAVGLSAAIVAHADFIYCTPHAYLLTPFSSLGLVAEGGASRAFVERMGLARATEALLTSRKVGAEELRQCGFVNRIFREGGGDEATGKGCDDGKFLDAVLAEVQEKLGSHLNRGSLLGIKKLLRAPGMAAMDRAGVDEVWAGLKVFMDGTPQKEFARLASGEKRHKL